MPSDMKHKIRLAQIAESLGIHTDTINLRSFVREVTTREIASLGQTRLRKPDFIGYDGRSELRY